MASHIREMNLRPEHVDSIADRVKAYVRSMRKDQREIEGYLGQAGIDEPRLRREIREARKAAKSGDKKGAAIREVGEKRIPVSILAEYDRRIKKVRRRIRATEKEAGASREDLENSPAHDSPRTQQGPPGEKGSRRGETCAWS